MFLQNLYVWKPFRAVAALMLVVVMATACQETAQQVIQKSASAPLAQSESTQQNNMVAQSTSLSDAEKALVKKMEGDKDIAAMNQMQKTLVFKMKIALGYDKEKFKQAIINKDHKTYIALMNFSESEYAEFSSKLQGHLSNFKTRYADDIIALEALTKRNPTVCKTCQSGSPDLDAAALDERLAIIEKANVGSMDKMQAFDENACRQNNPDAYNAYKEAEAIIYSIFTACAFGSLISLNPLAFAGCSVMWAASLIYAQCNTCGCPW